MLKLILTAICAEKLPRSSPKRELVVSWLEVHKEARDRSPYAGREDSHVLAFENYADFHKYYLTDCELFDTPEDERAGYTVFAEAVRARVKTNEFVWQGNNVRTWTV